MADIPSQISFEQMLSHMFPGLFSAITIFMLLDTWSSVDLTKIILTDINALVAFAGLIFIAGTILGIIIDAVHHNILEKYFFEGYDKQKHCITYQDIIDYFENVHCRYIFNWDKIPMKETEKDWENIKKNKDSLKKSLLHKFCEGWIRDADVQKKSEDTIRVFDKSKDTNWIKLNLTDHGVVLESHNNKKDILKVKFEKDGTKIIDFACEDIGQCKFCKEEILSPAKIYYFFKIDENVLNNYISIYEHLRRSIFHYYEFYINTFVAILPFTFIAPIYIHDKLEINMLYSMTFGVFLSILTYLCLWFGYCSRQRYIEALYFAYCNCRR